MNRLTRPSIRPTETRIEYGYRCIDWERDRIVEWLRDRQAAVLPGSEGSALMADTFRHAAACIENGAHR
jgi:hypothetical protein